jgi:hypothetical protein
VKVEEQTTSLFSMHSNDMKPSFFLFVAAGAVL